VRVTGLVGDAPTACRRFALYAYAYVDYPAQVAAQEDDVYQHLVPEHAGGCRVVTLKDGLRRAAIGPASRHLIMTMSATRTGPTRRGHRVPPVYVTPVSLYAAALVRNTDTIAAPVTANRTAARIGSTSEAMRLEMFVVA
jgi:hypothetical protein